MRALLIAVAVLMLLGTLAAAQKVISPAPNVPAPVPLQIPAPSAANSNSPTQAKPSGTDKSAEPDQRGTQESPFIVKIFPTPKTEAETRQAEEERESKSAADWWMVRFTAILGFIGFLQLLAFGWQGWQLRRGVSVAGQAANEARDAIKASQASAEAANTHSRAAEEANRINRDLLIVTQRPWIAAQLRIAGDLTYRSDGAAVIPITCALKNTGRTPAIFVWPHIRGVLQGPAGKNNAGLQRLFMTEIRQGGGISRQFGHTIFPEQEIPVDSAIVIENEEIKTSQAQGAEREILQIIAIGFVDYQFTFPAQPRETGFIYIVLAEHPQSHIMTPTIFRDLGDIPRDKLDVRPWWVDGAGFLAT